jgi:hypothetical protein
LLVSRATASPRKRALRYGDLDVDDLWRPLVLSARLSLRRKEMHVKARKHARNEGSLRFKSAPLRQRVSSLRIVSPRLRPHLRDTWPKSLLPSEAVPSMPEPRPDRFRRLARSKCEELIEREPTRRRTTVRYHFGGALEGSRPSPDRRGCAAASCCGLNSAWIRHG